MRSYRRPKPGAGAPKTYRKGVGSDDTTDQAAKTVALKQDVNPERLALPKWSWETADA